MSIASHGRNAKISKSAYADGRNHRREVKIREYLLKQKDHASGASPSETAVHIVQDLGFYVSDKRAHEWWCSLFDMTMAGIVIEEPDGSSVRLATEEELKELLTGTPADKPIRAAIVMLAHQKEAGND